MESMVMDDRLKMAKKTCFYLQNCSSKIHKTLRNQTTAKIQGDLGRGTHHGLTIEPIIASSWWWLSWHVSSFSRCVPNCCLLDRSACYIMSCWVILGLLS